MLELQGISKTYQRNTDDSSSDSAGTSVLTALDNINLTVVKNDFLAITGPSGSGKSTLLSILGCLDNPSSGQYLFDGHAVNHLSDEALAKIRNHQIGFIFQSYNLIPRYTALSNVQLPMAYAGVAPELREKRAMLALKAVGLVDRMHHKPSELSGGQQQRVAIARAIVNNPNLIIADEPTGSLDDDATLEIIKLFQQLHQSGKTIVLVTHNMDLLPYANRVIKLEAGRLVSC